MGSCTSRSDGMLPSQHAQHAPMWVVNVKHILEMTETFQAHQVLKNEGLLDIWKPKMFTIFISHQWLSDRHPDPQGLQLKVLQHFLSKLMTQTLHIDGDVISQWNRRTSDTDLGIAEAYVWLDYFCVPQLVDGYEVAEEQLLYVHSIPNYVHCCNIFVALVPKATHSTGKPCHFHSWLQRGWCRTELWCHFLSARSKTPIVVVKSHDVAQFSSPVWHRYPVHSGDFAVEKDRASCSRVIQAALSEYLSQLYQSKNKTTYRLYLSLFEDMTGLPRKCRSIEDFLVEFSFSKPLAKHKGLGPIACAALCGDPILIRELAAAKASLETRAPGMAEMMNMSDAAPLHLAAWFHSDLQVLETLLELRANPNSSSIMVPAPLGLCRTAAAVDLLVAHGAGVNFRVKERLMQFFPIQVAAGLEAPYEVLAQLLDKGAAVNGGSGGLASASPLHMLALGEANLESAELLLEHKADINQVCQPQGLAKSMELIYRLYNQFSTKPTIILRYLRDLSTTPLGFCAILGNEALLTFLLRARADVEIKNNRGLTAMELARSEQIREILRNPRQHIYLLEHHSQLMSQTF